MHSADVLQTSPMAFLAALRFRVSTSLSFHYSERPSFRVSWKQNNLALISTCKKRGTSLWIAQSILDKRMSGLNDNGYSEPAKVLLERLFVQTQKLEEQISRDSLQAQNDQTGLSLETLESDLHTALMALIKKEEDLQDAERLLLLEQSELNRAKKELEQRENDIATASGKHGKLEEELNHANLDLASQARKIAELQLLLKERSLEIASSENAFFLKEEELHKMREELEKRTEEASKTISELGSKSQLLNDANEVVNKQKEELLHYQKVIQEKEEELEAAMKKSKLEEEKLKVAEANLEKKTMEWFIAQDELKKLVEDASKRAVEATEAIDDFRRVKKLLNDVRHELIVSQKSLTSSRQKMKEQEQLLDNQMAELEEQRNSIMAYTTSLKNAQIEVESERMKLRIAEARNQELERDLSMEKDLMAELEEELKKEKSSLQQAIDKVSFLHEELELKNTEFGKTRCLLQAKEGELVEAKMEIEQSKSERASLLLILEEKDLEMLDAQKRFVVLNQDIYELNSLMKSKEDQLIQAASMLKEKEECLQTVQNELSHTTLKYSEAETVVNRIVDLTNKLVLSTKERDDETLKLFGDANNDLLQELQDKDKPTDRGFRLQRKQLETELESTRESLRQKEREVLAVRRDLTAKDEEMKTVLERLDDKEEEMKKLKKEMDDDPSDLKKLYALTQERIGKKSIGDLAIEKIQLEAAQLEIEAATTALQKVAEMSRELLNKARQSMEADIDTSSISIPQNDLNDETSMIDDDTNKCFTDITVEVSRLSALTEQLVKEAGIVVPME